MDKTIENNNETITNNNETLVKVFTPDESLKLVADANALIEERAQALCEKRAEQLQAVLESKAEVAEAYLKQKEQELEYKYKEKDAKLEAKFLNLKAEVENQAKEDFDKYYDKYLEADRKYKELKASRREQTKKEVLDFAEGELLAFLKIKRGELKGWRNSEKRRTINNFILFMEEVMNVKSNFLNYHDLESRFEPKN